ncbi:MAG: hypothetical protein GYB68_00590 [Chloroflexi bacterium]|nr:hypothetical protein [Chloroflexota bacterium]
MQTRVNAPANSSADPAPEDDVQVEWIVAAGLGGLLVIALFVIAGILVARARQAAVTPPPIEQTPRVSFDILTAREAYPEALEIARQVEAGAQLVSAASAWTPVINLEQLRAGRSGWTFHFYLPSRAELATVVVDLGGEVSMVETQLWDSLPLLIEDDGWALDSSQVMPRFFDQCGSLVETLPEPLVEARLSAAANLGRLHWRVTLIEVDNPSTVLCELNVDATTGQER